EYKGTEGIFLDANENPYGSALDTAYNRYPDPLQKELKEKISGLKRVGTGQIFLGNGSDEPIDLLVRAFCNPGKDNVITMPPTYGMYEVSAGINDVRVNEVPLTEEFQINTAKVLAAIDANTKIIFVCSPNNPTGNCLYTNDIVKILEGFDGIVVIDEAYIDFAPDRSFLSKLKKYPNLVVLQTFSKAWGMAALRLGMAFASEEIISVLNKIKPPYNINEATQRLASDGLRNILNKERMVERILNEREKLSEELSKIKSVLRVYPSDANFLLVKTADGNKAYDYLISKKIITRNRSNIKLCEGCLRITVGTAEENRELIKALQDFH
ncbi:MAG: histidinol-phosphate transaminase, partial [Cytophagaceae bacterium]